MALAIEGERLLGGGQALFDLGVSGIAAGDGVAAFADLVSEGAELIAQLGDADSGGGVFGSALIERCAGSDNAVLGIAPALAVEGPQQVAEFGGEAAMLGRALSLAAQLGEPRFDLAHNDGDAVDVIARGREAVLGFFDLGAEALDIGRFVEERAALLRRHAEHFIHEALAHDRVAVLADVPFHQEVEDVTQTDT